MNTSAGITNVLLLNPNTSTDVTERCVRHIKEALHGERVAELMDAVNIQHETVKLGAPYISDEESYAVAQYAVVQEVKSLLLKVGTPHLVLICCFGDPGVYAAREILKKSQCTVGRVPTKVFGLLESSMICAIEQMKPDKKFTIITGGEKWKVMLQRIIFGLSQANTQGGDNYDYTSRLSSIRTITLTGDQIQQRPHESVLLLAEECYSALKCDKDCGAIILGGAGLCSIVNEVKMKVKEISREERPSQWDEDIIIIDSVADGFVTALNRITEPNS